MERVLSYQEALGEVLAFAERLPTPAVFETVPLREAYGRVLATPLIGERPQPAFPRSTRDGFAVRSGDVTGEAAALRLIGSLRAGESWHGAALQAGEAVEIMTGAPVPAGADAVLMVEHVKPGHEGVPEQLHPAAGRRLLPGENVVATGAEASAGTTLVPAGRLIGTPEISLAASCGRATLKVFGRPTVAIVATGDELVELGTTPAPSQIWDSNSHTLASLAAAEGATIFRLPPARDTEDDLRARLQEASAADLVLFSGGVSMGKYDLVEPVFRDAGATFVFTGAQIQPGRPVVFGAIPQRRQAATDPAEKPASGAATAFFGLPGNPISTEVCFRLFVAPLLRAMAGRTERAPRFAEATLAEEVQGGARVMRFLPALMEGDAEGVRVSLVPWHGSGDLAANGRANAFAVLPREVPVFHKGDRVRVLLR